MWAMAPYTPSAFAGAMPAYSAWKVKMRRSRSSRTKDPTRGPSRPNPPRRASLRVSSSAPREDTRSSGESKFDAM